MSYYTRVTFDFTDEPPTNRVAETACQWLTAQNCYAVEDHLEDFLRGWTEGATELKGFLSQEMEELMLSISAKYPESRFYVRGMGEEFGDVLRQFEGGKIVFKVGPFEDD